MSKCCREEFSNIKPPKNEIIWVQYIKNNNVTHIITSTKLRDYYYLYEVKDNKPIKTKYKARSPTELEDYIC